MTDVLITVDTELSAGLQARGIDAKRNFESSILGRAAGGEVGIGWQMDRMEAHGLRGVFFVDPMPALVLGPNVIADIVEPIIGRGHEVQLHAHTEWLEWVKDSPVGGRQGRNIGDFALDDQITLLRLASDLLVAAGAPPPIAFRAGNYGANNDTIRALAAIGVQWDASVNPAYLGQGCDMSFPPARTTPMLCEGVALLPVAGLYDRPGHFRPAQICAVSTTEMRAALDVADGAFVIVTHSFEMLSRDRKRPNRSIMARFEALCREVERSDHLRSATFSDLDADALVAARPAARLAPSHPRTAARMAEQLVATWRYERRLIPS